MVGLIFHGVITVPCLIFVAEATDMEKVVSCGEILDVETKFMQFLLYFCNIRYFLAKAVFLRMFHMWRKKTNVMYAPCQLLNQYFYTALKSNCCLFAFHILMACSRGVSRLFLKRLKGKVLS